jgi:hypothetical protein
MHAPLAGAAFKCVDEKGYTHFGDTPPAACANVVLYEVSQGGMVIRRIDPTPTADQLRLREEEAARVKAAAEQRRRDLALLSTFSSEREFDVVRDRSIEPITGRINLAKERIKAVDTRRQELEDEMEFYKAGKTTKAGGKPREAPFVLTSELQRIVAERQTLERTIVSDEREIEKLRTKFDTDKKRWVGLRNSGAGATASPADPPAEPAKPAAKK